MMSIEMGKLDECATRRSHHARDTFVHEHVDDVGDWLCTDAHLIGRPVSRILPRLVFNFNYIPLFWVLFLSKASRIRSHTNIHIAASLVRDLQNTPPSD